MIAEHSSVTHSSNTKTLNSYNGIELSIETFIKKFSSLTLKYAAFHIIFFVIGFAQILTLLLFFSFFSKTTWSAIALASLFLTTFSYLVLHFYFQARKPQQFLELRQEFQNESRRGLPTSTPPLKLHFAQAKAFTNLSTHLHEIEGNYYPIPAFFKTLAPLMKKFSVFMHWKDVHKIKELLLLSSINETVSVVKLMPTDLDAHANLATAYLSLANIYIHPSKLSPTSSLPWVSPEYSSKIIRDKFHSATDRAIEELSIINEYAPNNPWVHHQLAEIYRQKNLEHLEIQEYEILLKIQESDDRLLHRLGILYFNQGYNSKGLNIYQQLISKNQSLAEDLISHYTSFQFHELSIESLSSS
jgi:tetratricopeptide (TPR) repeat protein